MRWNVITITFIVTSTHYSPEQNGYMHVWYKFICLFYDGLTNSQWNFINFSFACFAVCSRVLPCRNKVSSVSYSHILFWIAHQFFFFFKCFTIHISIYSTSMIRESSKQYPFVVSENGSHKLAVLLSCLNLLAFIELTAV